MPFAKMELEVVGDNRRGGKQAVSINAKLGRLVIYQGVYQLFRLRVGREIEHVQLLTTPKFPKHFWIRACDPSADGARGVHKTGETRTISAKLLIQRLDIPKDLTARYWTEWDPANEALVIDLERAL